MIILIPKKLIVNNSVVWLSYCLLLAGVRVSPLISADQCMGLGVRFHSNFFSRLQCVQVVNKLTDILQHYTY